MERHRINGWIPDRLRLTHANAATRTFFQKKRGTGAPEYTDRDHLSSHPWSASVFGSGPCDKASSTAGRKRTGTVSAQ